MDRTVRTELSRNRILDAATEEFSAAGYGAGSLEAVARRAGMTRKTVYNHFGSKRELAEALIARIEAVGDPLYRALIVPGADVAGLLEQVLLDSAVWCLENPGLAMVALAPAERPGLTPPEGRPSFQRLIGDILRLGQDQKQIRADEDANFMAMLLLGIYAQIMVTVLAGHPYDPGYIRRLVRLTVQGIAA